MNGRLRRVVAVILFVCVAAMPSRVVIAQQMMAPGRCPGALFISPTLGNLGWPYMYPGGGVVGFDPDHTGIDILGNHGDLIFAVYPGTVSKVTGSSVTIRHPDLGVWTYYSHMRKVYVGQNQQVTQGFPIGEKSNVGTDVVHLHFSVKRIDDDERRRANTTDPSDFFKANLNYLKGARAYQKPLLGWCIPQETPTPEAGDVGGTVIDHRTGKPVVEARVRIKDRDNAPQKTDATGHYRFSGVRAGTVTLIAEDDQIGTGSVSAQIVAQTSVEAMPIRLTQPDQLGQDFALIIDSSGSMLQTDPSNLRKAAARLFAQALDPNDRITIVGFSSSAYVVWRLQSAGSSRSQISQEIDIRIGSSGGTNISDGLRIAYGQLNDGSNRRKSAILLSDGMQDGAPYDSQWQAAFAAKHWPVYTFGLSQGADVNRLSDIANRTGGKFHYLTDPAELTRLYNGLRIEVSGSELLADQAVVLRSGDTYTLDTPVPPYARAATFATSWPGSRVDTILLAPDGTLVTPSSLGSNVVYSKDQTFEVYRVTYPLPGTWRLIAYGADLAVGGETVTFQVDALVQLQQVALPLMRVGSSVTRPVAPIQPPLPPQATLALGTNDPVLPGATAELLLDLLAFEPTAWTVSQVRSTCNIAGLPQSQDFIPGQAQRTSTTITIPADTPAGICQLMATVVARGDFHTEVQSNVQVDLTIAATPEPPAPPLEPRWVPVDIAAIANSPMDHLAEPLSGERVLGTVPFTLLAGNRSVFQTRHSLIPDNPIEGQVTVAIPRPQIVHLLLNGGYVSHGIQGQKVGEVELRFTDGSTLTVDIGAWQTVREPWVYSDDPLADQLLAPPPGVSWRNVHEELQYRGDQLARGFIDMMSITIPEGFREKSLSRVIIRDTSEATAQSMEPSLVLMGLTVLSLQ